MIRTIRAPLFFLAIVGLCAYGRAYAQTQPWDTNVISFTAPSTCSTGEPVTACPVTGYRLERSATSSGTFTTLAALPSTVTSYTHNSVTAGTNCYRVFALSAQGDSGSSNIACKTNTKPVGPPNPPVLKVIDTVAYNVRPNYSNFTFVKYEVVGTAKLGATCDSKRFTNDYNGKPDGYMAVDGSLVTPKTTQVIVAHCG